jgi:hypothetical protein
MPTLHTRSALVLHPLETSHESTDCVPALHLPPEVVLHIVAAPTVVIVTVTNVTLSSKP